MAYCYDISKVIIVNTSLTLLFLPLLLLFHQHHYSYLGIRSIILATFRQWCTTRFVSCFLLKEILFKKKEAKRAFQNLWILAVVNWRYNIRKINVKKTWRNFYNFHVKVGFLAFFPLHSRSPFPLCWVPQCIGSFRVSFSRRSSMAFLDVPQNGELASRRLTCWPNIVHQIF